MSDHSDEAEEDDDDLSDVDNLSETGSTTHKQLLPFDTIKVDDKDYKRNNNSSEPEPFKSDVSKEITYPIKSGSIKCNEVIQEMDLKIDQPSIGVMPSSMPPPVDVISLDGIGRVENSDDSNKGIQEIDPKMDQPSIGVMPSSMPPPLDVIALDGIGRVENSDDNDREEDKLVSIKCNKGIQEIDPKMDQPSIGVMPSSIPPPVDVIALDGIGRVENSDDNNREGDKLGGTKCNEGIQEIDPKMDQPSIGVMPSSMPPPVDVISLDGISRVENSDNGDERGEKKSDGLEMVKVSIMPESDSSSSVPIKISVIGQEETCIRDTKLISTTEVPADILSENLIAAIPICIIPTAPSNNVDILNELPLDILYTDIAEASTETFNTAIAILPSTIPTAYLTTMTASVEPAVSSEVAVVKVPETMVACVLPVVNLLTCSKYEESNNITEEINTTYPEVENSKAEEVIVNSVAAKSKGTMLDMFLKKNKKLKSRIRKIGDFNVDGELKNHKGGKDLDNGNHSFKKVGRVSWNQGTSCLKKREVVIRLKIKVPHFKRSMIGRDASNRSLISMLSPQPPMWSSLSSLRYPAKDLDKDNTQDEALSKQKLSTLKQPSSIDATGYFNRPKLTFSKPKSDITTSSSLPWRPGSARLSPWMPKMIKFPTPNLSIISNEIAIKAILSVLPPLHSIVSQYESNSLFLHRILKAYQKRCKEINDEQKLRELSEVESKKEKSDTDIDITVKENESIDNQSISDTCTISEEINSVQTPIRTSESTGNQSVLGTCTILKEITSVYTPIRPSLTSPSASTRSPKTQSFAVRSHESSSIPSVTHQSTPINSIVKSILHSNIVKISPRRSKLNYNENKSKIISKLHTPTTASAASRYQRQFFCADNR